MTFDVQKLLVDLYRELQDKQTDLEPSMKQVLYEKLWDLYDDGVEGSEKDKNPTEPANTGKQ